VQGEIEHHLQECSDCRLVLDAATTLDRYSGCRSVSDSQRLELDYKHFLQVFTAGKAMPSCHYFHLTWN